MNRIDSWSGRAPVIEEMRHGFDNAIRFVDQHRAALLVMFVAFIGRFFLSGVNSYWLDEIYSVYVHATTRETTSDVIDSMRGIIHPPLYQITLFQWIKAFGHTEAATRSLSNVFVMLGSGFLYLLAFKMYGKRTALVTLVVFSFMHVPIFYALETRSYAMVIMLATASSLSLYYFLATMPVLRSWATFLTDRNFLILTAVNTAAIFTHYYAAFFVAAQGMYVLSYLLYRHDGWRRPWALVKLALFGAIPPAVLVALWGRSMATRYEKGGRFQVDDSSVGFPDAFLENVIEPNVDPTAVGVLIVALFVLIYAVRSVIKIVKSDGAVLNSYMTVYAVVWLMLPVALSYVLLKMVGQDAYDKRYFVFSSPAIALLLAAGFFELIRLSSLGSKKLFGVGTMKSAYRLSAVLGIVLATVTVLPKGYSAATHKKHDWRLIATLIAGTVKSDRKSSYIVYDTGFRKNSMLNYYFERQNSSVRARSVVTKGNEDKKKLPFRSDRKRIRNHDYLVIAFTHLDANRYKNTLRYLNKHYEEHYRVMPMNGRGYIVYRTH